MNSMNVPLWRAGVGCAMCLAGSAVSADEPVDRGWYLEASVLDIDSSGGDERVDFDLDSAGLGATLRF